MYNSFMRFGKLGLDAFEGIMSVIDCYYALESIRDLWSEEFKQTYTLKARIAIFIFYIVHISLIVMANAYVVYWLGEFLLSASLASLLVNFSTLANNLFEYLHKHYQNYMRMRERDKLKSELEILDINFEQNPILLKDFVEKNSEIDVLRAQQSELVVLLSQLESETVAETDQYFRQLADIAEVIKAKCDVIANEQRVIDTFYKKHHVDIDEQKIICDTNIEIKLIHEYKKEIRVAISDLKAQHRYDGSAEARLYESHLKALDSKMQECAIINQHFYKLFKSKNVLVEIDNQIANLDKKYSAEPYIHCDILEKNQIKQIELNYLNERRTSINNFIRHPVQPQSLTRNQARLDIRYNASAGLRSLEERQSKATLKNILTSQIATLEHLLVDANKELDKKKEFIQTITSNPKSDIKHDFNKIAIILNKINKIDKEIKVASQEVKHKLWSTYSSGVAAAVAILVSYFSYRIDSSIAEGISKAFTIFGAASTIHARSEILKAKASQQREEREEASIIKVNLHSRAENLFDPELRESCLQRANEITQELEREYPMGAQAAALSVRRSPAYLPRASQKSSPRSTQTPQRGAKAAGFKSKMAI